MATEPARARRNLKANTGRIIRVEQYLGRLEKRIERLEKQNSALRIEKANAAPNIGKNELARLQKQNANLKSELSKLRARVDQNTKDHKQTASTLARLMGLCEPVQALVRGFKQTPGAPFDTWRVWMLSTLRKQGVYRKQMFQ